MKTIINTDGVRLKEVLDAAGMTQKELVRATGLEQSVISRITTGRFRATSQEKLRISLVLGRKVEEIFP